MRKLRDRLASFVLDSKPEPFEAVSAFALAAWGWAVSWVDLSANHYDLSGMAIIWESLSQIERLMPSELFVSAVLVAVGLTAFWVSVFRPHSRLRVYSVCAVACAWLTVSWAYLHCQFVPESVLVYAVCVMSLYLCARILLALDYLYSRQSARFAGNPYRGAHGRRMGGLP